MLAGYDIGALYRLLGDDAGLIQHQIAEHTGQSQSEASEIVKGRRVIAYDVYERIATGLGIPPELMGMSWWAPDGTYCGGATATGMAEARQLWTPTRTDPYGDVDRATTRLEIERGRLDIAESLAAASVRRWEGGSRLSRTLSGIVPATIHVKAGEPTGLTPSHRAITSVIKLSSTRARTWLTPLAAELQAPARLRRQGTSLVHHPGAQHTASSSAGSGSVSATR